MARKRKIPARKHHGIRDPLRQQEDKEKKLKNVVNRPPQKDDQKISYKFAQFKKLADRVKSGKKIKRIHSGVEDKPKSFTDTTNKNPKAEGNKFKSIKRMPGENDLKFTRRVNRITSESLMEAQYEAKYGVKVIRDAKTGNISIKKKPPNEIDELLKQKKNEIRSGKIKKKNTESDKLTKPIDPKLVKELIKQAIKEDKEEKIKEKEKEIIEYRKDVFKFGEVVHAPPNISVLPRKAQKNETVPRPGKKSNLLLKDILKSPEDDNPEVDDVKNKPKASNKKVNSGHTIGKSELKGKRKALPEATRNMLESERQKLVNLYRDLRKAKGVQADKS